MPKSRKPKRTRLEKLQNSWVKASAEERDAFLAFIGKPQPTGGLPTPSITTGRYLTADAAARIVARLKARKMSVGDLKEKLGLEADDRSLERALALKSSLRLSVVAGLEAWLGADDRS